MTRSEWLQHLWVRRPASNEANWLQTVPEKGWFILLRIYSPTRGVVRKNLATGRD